MSKYRLPTFADQVFFKSRCFECRECQGWNSDIGQFECDNMACYGQERHILVDSFRDQFAKDLQNLHGELLYRLSVVNWGDKGHSKIYKQALRDIALLQADTIRIPHGKTHMLEEGSVVEWLVDKDTNELVLKYRTGH